MSDATAAADAPPTIADLQRQIAELKASAQKKDRWPDTQSVLAISIIYGAIGLIVFVIVHPPDEKIASTVFSQIGTFIAIAGIVGGWYLGSSKSSTTKDEARDATMTTLVNKVVENGAPK